MTVVKHWHVRSGSGKGALDTQVEAETPFDAVGVAIKLTRPTTLGLIACVSAVGRSRRSPAQRPRPRGRPPELVYVGCETVLRKIGLWETYKEGRKP